MVQVLINTARLLNNHHQVLSNRKFGRPNNVRVFGSKNTKRHNQNRQNRLKSPMTEGEEP
jgi:hypothetical protein